MAVSTQKVLASGGGHSGQVGMTINEKELKDIIKSLDALRLDEKGDKKILQKAMRQAARPILKELRANVDTMIKPSREELLLMKIKLVFIFTFLNMVLMASQV